MGVSHSLSVTQVSQNVGSNTSVIRINWTSTQDGSSYNVTGSASAYYLVYVNGELVLEHWPNFLLHKNTTEVLVNETMVVSHDDEGECTVQVKTWMDTRLSDGEIEKSRTLVLDPIPRTSTLSASNGTLGTEMTLTINRKADSFKHRITFNISEEFAGYIAGSTTGYTTATSIKWTPQIAYSRANVTGVSVQVRLTLDTYASNGAYIGTDVKTITCAIPDSVKPTCSLEIVDASGYDAVYGAPVQGLSKIHYKVTATESYGSAIASYSVDAAGFFFNGAEGTTPELLASGSATVMAKVTDQRGRSASASASMEVTPYTSPSVTALSVIRCDFDGVENAQGKYVRINFSATATSLNEKNSVRYSLKYKPTTGEAYTEAQLPALDNMYSVDNYAYIFSAADSSSFDVTVTVADNHRSTSRSTSASTAFTFMDWHPTGTGIAFGKVSEKERTMEIAMHAEIQGTLARLGNQYSVFVPEGNPNSASPGFDLMARITVIGSYANAPLTFVFTRRNAMYPMTVHFSFQNVDTLDPYIGFRTVDGEDYGAYLVKVNASVWDLYVARGSGYDFITLQNWHTAQYMESRVEVSFPSGYRGSINPNGMDIVQLTPVMSPALLDAVYPVDSIYISYSHTDPSMTFGGVWERLSNAFLWGTDPAGTIGETGGESEHVLTIDEMPAHNHAGVRRANNYISGTNSTGESSGSADSVMVTDNTGGGLAHNNMPPYISVSIWRRTA